MLASVPMALWHHGNDPADRQRLEELRKAAGYDWRTVRSFRSKFQALPRVPIIVYYGDNIPTEPTDIAGRDNWRVRQHMARLWVEAVNRHGGDATLVSLPEQGIRGNAHFAFSDLNNHEIADQITAFLAERSLDGPAVQP